MQNVVSLRSDRPRPQRMFDVPRSGARILFFTGVRYCRDEGDDASHGDASRGDARGAAPLALRLEAGCGGHRVPAAARAVDATAH